MIILASCALASSQVPDTPIRVFEDWGPDKCTTSMVDTSNMPDNRDQRNLYWCHAYAFADLMSFYAKKKISAYGVALESYQSKSQINNNFPNYGYGPSHHFYNISNSKRGLCKEKNFQSTSESDWNRLSDALKRLSEKKLDPSSLLCSRAYHDLTAGIDPKTLETLSKLSGEAFVQATLVVKCKERVPMTEGTFVNHEISYDHTKFNQLIKCHTDSKRSEICDVEKTPKDDLKSEELLDGKLNQQEPVIVSYDVSLLRSKYGGEINKNYNHFSTVIGRKYNVETKTCEYLLRNSWGTDCSHYAERLQKGCDQGNIWISRQDLLKSAGGIQTFNPEE